MILSNRSRSSGTLAVILAATLAMAGVANAETVKTVNGVEIDSVVLSNYLQSRLQKPAAQATPDERAAILDEITDIYLLATQPKAKELEKSPELAAQLELQYRGLLAQAVAADYMAGNEATEDEIFEEYSEQIARSPSEQFKARHILVETQAKAMELIEQLKSGADFVELAKANSTGPSGPNGGDLGWFPPDQMVAPFSAAVVELENGKFTEEPVQTQFGWHVILREDSRENEPPTLESVRQVVKQQVEARKFQEYLESLRSANSGD
ncbi:MAG: peptidylprolyl isomerase [Woeseiaceae bacterium]|nr:peptidylprolyl isomerase [Woeseiaceae bacterium]